MYSLKYSPIYLSHKNKGLADALIPWLCCKQERKTLKASTGHTLKTNEHVTIQMLQPARKHYILLHFFVEIFSDNKLRLKLLLEYYSTLVSAWCMWLICSWSVCRYYKPNLSFLRVCSSMHYKLRCCNPWSPAHTWKSVCKKIFTGEKKRLQQHQYNYAPVDCRALLRCF